MLSGSIFDDDEGRFEDSKEFEQMTVECRTNDARWMSIL